VVYGNKLYLVGGYDGASGTFPTRVDVYDFETSVWSLAAEMNDGRSNHAAIVRGDMLYVIGGLSERGMETYNFKTEVWTSIATGFTIFREDAAIAAHGENLYIVGGTHDDSLTPNEDARQIEVYNCTTGHWSMFATGVSVARKGCAAFVRDGHLWVVGGEDMEYDNEDEEDFLNLGDETPSSMEVCDLATGKWTSSYFHDAFRFVDHSLLVHDNTLYAIGADYSSFPQYELNKIAVYPLPPILLWNPSKHSQFPSPFKHAVHIILLCFTRSNIIPDDLLFLIFAMLERTVFPRPLSRADLELENIQLRDQLRMDRTAAQDQHITNRELRARVDALEGELAVLKAVHPLEEVD
jgi:hypothetical protein